MSNFSRFQGIPDIIYGTAFKFDKSTILVERALKAGFKGIDTAGSRSAYREAFVGDAIKIFLKSSRTRRTDLYIQTKFSPFKPTQDPALYPYDTTRSIPEQVEESITSSLANLGIDYIDCLVLHSIYPSLQDNIIAWKAMEKLVPEKVTLLGLSNIDLETLKQIYNQATIKPSVVQNRFTHDTIDRPNLEMPSNLPYPKITFDRDVREYCQQYGLTYAPWGLLWGSLDVLDGPDQIITKAAQELQVSRHIACFAFMKTLGGCKISILCGTTKEERMHETLVGLAKIDTFSANNGHTWKERVKAFKTIVDG